MKITVVVKRVGLEGKLVEVENTLKAFQDIVGGYITTFPLMTDTFVVCNEEGLMRGLEPNVDIILNQYRETIYGDFAIVRKEGDEFESLSSEQIEILKNSGLIQE